MEHRPKMIVMGHECEKGNALDRRERKGYQEAKGIEVHYMMHV
jgi:hypothetical protein